MMLPKIIFHSDAAIYIFDHNGQDVSPTLYGTTITQYLLNSIKQRTYLSMIIKVHRYEVLQTKETLTITP